MTADIEARLRGGCGNCGFVDSTREDAADRLRDLEAVYRWARSYRDTRTNSSWDGLINALDDIEVRAKLDRQKEGPR